MVHKIVSYKLRERENNRNKQAFCLNPSDSTRPHKNFQKEKKRNMMEQTNKTKQTMLLHTAAMMKENHSA
jgi:hypothetical protein